MIIEKLKERELCYKKLCGYAEYEPEILFLLEGAEKLSIFYITEIEKAVRDNLPQKYEAIDYTTYYNYGDIAVLLSGKIAKITLQYECNVVWKNNIENKMEKHSTTFYMCRNNDMWHIL